MTVWPAAIPFANVSEAIAFSVLQGEDASYELAPPSPQAFVADVTLNASLDDLASLRFDWWHFPLPTSRAAQPTQAPVSSPTSLDEPTALPDPTPTPQPTSTPQPTQRPTAQPTNAPDPTPQPTPKQTAQPTPQPTPKATPEPTPKPTPEPTAKPTPSATPSPTPTPKPTPAPDTYTGQSHFWYPALDIDASWSWYGCDHGGDPTMGAGVYRWGCGPDSNTYLLSHAWSIFKKVRQGFHSGALQVGQSVWYSNAQGDVTEWRVRWIRRVTDEYLDATASEWAMNDSATPIMTLQTCDGSQSQYRIIVRLTPAD